MSLKDKVPSYLLDKDNMVSSVTFTAFFSIVFILCTTPLVRWTWFDLGRSHTFGLTVLFFAVALLILVFSKMMMYGMRQSLSFTYVEYVVWHVGEAVAISLVYSVITSYGGYMGFIDCGARGFQDFFTIAIVYAIVSIGLSAVLCAQYFALHDRDNTIRFLNMGSVVSDRRASASEEKRITLFDNNGVLKLSLSQDSLYYIESDDNYIQVWYKDKEGEKRQYMLRCRLKTIEDSFEDSDLVRCHRKYIVNISKVSILKAEKEGYELSVDLDGVEPIPVSKTYEAAVLSRFNSRF